MQLPLEQPDESIRTLPFSTSSSIMGSTASGVDPSAEASSPRESLRCFFKRAAISVNIYALSFPEREMPFRVSHIPPRMDPAMAIQKKDAPGLLPMVANLKKRVLTTQASMVR